MKNEELIEILKTGNYNKIKDFKLKNNIENNEKLIS